MSKPASLALKQLRSVAQRDVPVTLSHPLYDLLKRGSEVDALQLAREDSLRRAILAWMGEPWRRELSHTVGEIAEGVERPTPAVQYALHQLDDAGHLVMRNGWYRLSEAAKNTLTSG